MPSLKISDLIRIGARSALLPILLFGLVPQASAQVDLQALAEEFSWREVGPANPGGRITDVEGVESAPHNIYAGTATGGLWRTVNAGINSVFWDQRENPPPTPEPREGQPPRSRRPRVGPLVPPGEYLVRLTVGDEVLTTTLVIEQDVPGYMGR